MLKQKIVINKHFVYCENIKSYVFYDENINIGLYNIPLGVIAYCIELNLSVVVFNENTYTTFDSFFVKPKEELINNLLEYLKQNPVKFDKLKKFYQKKEILSLFTQEKEYVLTPV